MSGGNLDLRTLILLIWNTGALFGLTPFGSDLRSYVECDIPVRDVPKVNKVIGIGTTVHKFTDTNGNPVFLPCVSCHLPQTDVRLFSPQTYHQMNGGYSEVYSQSIQMKLRTSCIHIDILRDQANLPVVHESYVLEKAKPGLGPIMRSGICQRRLSVLDFFGEIASSVSSIVGIQNQTAFLVSPVSVIQRMPIRHPLSRNFYYGAGNLISVCIVFRSSCGNGLMRRLWVSRLCCHPSLRLHFLLPRTVWCHFAICASSHVLGGAPLRLNVLRP